MPPRQSILSCSFQSLSKRSKKYCLFSDLWSRERHLAVPKPSAGICPGAGTKYSWETIDSIQEYQVPKVSSHWKKYLQCERYYGNPQFGFTGVERYTSNIYWELNLPWFAEKLVLDEDRDEKHGSSLDRHGAKVLPHHVPAEWVFKTVFTWLTNNKYAAIKHPRLTGSSQGEGKAWNALWLCVSSALISAQLLPLWTKTHYSIA